MIIMALYLFMDLVAVSLERYLCFKSVVELLELLCDCFSVLLWSVVCYKLLGRYKSKIVCKKLCLSFNSFNFSIVCLDLHS